MHRLILPLSLFAAACSITPSHAAHRSQEFTLPATGLHSIDCTSQNGEIVVRGGSGDEVRVHVVLTAYGSSQQEAEARLVDLDVEHRIADTTLILRGSPAESPAWGCSPGFAFTLEVPRALALLLNTHNGRIQVDGVDGDVTLSTHNGEIAADVASGRVDIETHNGGVEFQARGAGSLNGRIQSHNGGVEVKIGAGVDTHVDARTSNGAVVGDEAVAVNRRDRSHAEATFGNGGGTLDVSTHNGSVRLR